MERLPDLIDVVTQCVYCDHSRDLTRDHIPPKSLYPKPMPCDLITVPCCYSCNQSFQKDDYLLRYVLTLTVGISENLAAEAVREKVIKDFERKEQEKLRNALGWHIYPDIHPTPYGLYLGNTIGHNILFQRLDNVLGRIVKALYYFECKIKLSKNYHPYSVPIYSLKSSAFNKKIMYLLLHQDLQRKNDEVFQYRFYLSRHTPYWSVWLLTFYKKWHFLYATIPKL